MADTPKDKTEEKSLADKMRDKIRESPLTYVALAGGLGLLVGWMIGGRKPTA